MYTKSQKQAIDNEMAMITGTTYCLNIERKEIVMQLILIKKKVIGKFFF